MTKRLPIKRADGSIIWAEKIGAHSYRLTYKGKPYSFTDSFEAQIEKGLIKK